MGERTEPPSTSERKQSNERPNDVHPSRQALLEESRTTANRQLTQITKLDDAAVRTVRMAFLLLGIVAGGSRLSPLLNLGWAGTLATWSLLGSLFAGLFVYGNSRLFLGSSPDRLTVKYDDDPAIKRTHVELIGEYEDGIQFNRDILHINGFALLVARSLLALAVVLFASGLVRYVVLSGGMVSIVQTFIS